MWLNDDSDARRARFTRTDTGWAIACAGRGAFMEQRGIQVQVTREGQP